MWHHDTPIDREVANKFPYVLPIHAKGSLGGKVPWERINGSQVSLIKQVWEMIGYTPRYSKLLEDSAVIENVA